MHALNEHLYPITEQGRERFRELFGIAGRRKPSIFWYNGSSFDLSPICRITNRRFNYSSIQSYTNYTPTLQTEPELYIYTDSITPFDTGNQTFDDTIETIQEQTKERLNTYGFGAAEYKITGAYELIVPHESSLYGDSPYYIFQQGYKEYNDDGTDRQNKLSKAYLLDIELTSSNKVISILYWKIGNMKFLKDVALPKGMNIDYILRANLMPGPGPIATNLIIACAGALKLKGLFFQPTVNSQFRTKINALYYIEDRMKFINSSKNKFTDYTIYYKGLWTLENSTVETYNLDHNNEMLTLKKEDEIRNELIISTGMPPVPNSSFFDFILG